MADPSGTSAAEPKVTIRQVAVLAGVSPSAVSHVFNGRSDIAPATKERILAAAAELNWRPAAAALALAAARTRTFGYVVLRDPDLVRGDPFFVDVISGVQRALAEGHYNLLVRLVSTREEELDTYRKLSQARQVDGFLLVDHRAEDPRYRIIAEAGLSGVAIGRPFPGCPFPAVTADPADAGMTEALRELARLGHRSIGYVGGPEEFASARFRRERVEQAAAEAGLVLLTRSDRTEREAVAEATRALLSGESRPTAIVYSNDLMAMWGMAAAEDAGFRVPQDLSVLGHDDAPFAGFTRPSLASVHVDVSALADAAARTLIAVTAGEPVPPSATAGSRFERRDSIAEAPRPS
ncbi:MAG TPA: LacI family DNA-binding transcriptional regulator [Naasia sp.]|jgi:DNA-binding LacI/PurR family transcriptional regulator